MITAVTVTVMDARRAPIAPAPTPRDVRAVMNVTTDMAVKVISYSKDLPNIPEVRSGGLPLNYLTHPVRTTLLGSRRGGSVLALGPYYVAYSSIGVAILMSTKNGVNVRASTTSRVTDSCISATQT